ncbi:hypothetical protein [Streptomyces sp. NPDC048565]|uniref:hypothetical protein n=1 Tax=Streptomyces sp. NPDC048565 TaxID=3155266 RepID=UPI003435D3AB
MRRFPHTPPLSHGSSRGARLAATSPARRAARHGSERRRRGAFTLDDAASLRTYATRQGVGALSLWASFRDQECASGEDTTAASDSRSGADQDAGAFAEALSG